MKINWSPTALVLLTTSAVLWVKSKGRRAWPIVLFLRQPKSVDSVLIIDCQQDSYRRCDATTASAVDIVRRTCGRASVSLVLLLVLLLSCVSASWAKGNMKGNLDDEELHFINHTFIPILIRSNVCVRADGDCLHYFITCTSHESLSCDVYGITDEKVIKEIFLAMLRSGLNVSSFTFWRSKYHETSLFEKPLLQYVDRTGSK